MTYILVPALYAVARPSVVCLSVTLVGRNFRQGSNSRHYLPGNYLWTSFSNVNGVSLLLFTLFDQDAPTDVRRAVRDPTHSQQETHQEMR